VVEAYKRDKSIKPTFRQLGAIQYDQRNSHISADGGSLTTLQKGRLKLSTIIGEYDRSRFKNIRRQFDLLYDKLKHVLYISVTVDTPEEPKYKHTDVIGVDMGVINIAVDSDKQVFDTDKTESARRKGVLQRVGTRSAKRPYQVRRDALRRTLITLYQNT
jgi:putative transposase